MLIARQVSNSGVKSVCILPEHRKVAVNLLCSLLLLCLPVWDRATKHTALLFPDWEALPSPSLGAVWQQPLKWSVFSFFSGV